MMWPVKGLILTYSGLGFRVASSCFFSVSSAPLNLRTRVSLRLPPDLCNWYTGRPFVGVRVTEYGSDERRTSVDAGLAVRLAAGSGDGCVYLLVRKTVLVTGPPDAGSVSVEAVGCVVPAAVARYRWGEEALKNVLGCDSERAMQRNRKTDMAAAVATYMRK